MYTKTPALHLINWLTRSKEGRLVEIIGDEDSDADNYYLKFTDGAWTETTDPTVDVEIDADHYASQVVH